MGVFFANPLWLLGLLALVPLAAHLFSRTRPRKRPFPSLVLLREAIRRVTRVRRPQDRWLLLLRTLAILAIVLAFLQPWLLSRFSSGGSAPKTMVLVVDASASMGYVDGTRTRLTQATGAAEEILGSLPRNSRANVVWIRGQAESALPEPGQNIEFLREELRRAAARPEAGDIDGAITLALKQLAGVDGDRELCVISDFQRSAWQERDWAMPPNVRLTRVAIGEGQEANVALGSIELEPTEPSVGQTANLVARVRNLSGESRRVTVYGEAGASRLSQTVDLAPWSDGLAMMPVTFGAEGVELLRASLGEDRYPGDDVRYALATVRGALPVGMIGNADKPTPKTWLRAMQALDGVSVRAVPLEQAATSGVKVLFVADWNGIGVDQLRAYLRTGGALVVQPGPSLSVSAVEGLFHEGVPAGESGTFKLEERPAPGWGLRIVAEDHPIFGLFAAGAYGDPVSGRFRQRMSPSIAGSEFRPLLAFEDGSVALGLRELRVTETPMRVVPVVWWNLELGASDWTSHSAFLPFFGEFLKHIAGFTRYRDHSEFRAGETLRYEVDPAIDPRDVELLDGADKKVIASNVAGGRSGELATAEKIVPGAYRWMAQGGVLKRMVVNFPETESDLRRIDRATLEKSGGEVIAGAGGNSLARLREGVALWPWCLAFAAACLLFEGLLLRGMMRSGKTTEAEVSTSGKKKNVEEVVPV